MKTAELRDLTVAELKEKEVGLEEEVFRLKIKRYATQLDNKMVLRNKKRDLARLKTIIREKAVLEENTK
jgi:large subunit ribosomal protein L29